MLKKTCIFSLWLVAFSFLESALSKQVASKNSHDTLSGYRAKRECNGGGCGGGNGGCNGGNCGRSGGRSSDTSRSAPRSDTNIGLRELLQLLPYLSNTNAAPVAPVAQSTIAHYPFPPVSLLGGLPPSSADVAGGALAQLAKILTKRQAPHSPEDMKTRLDQLIASAPALGRAAAAGGRLPSGFLVNGYVPAATTTTALTRVTQKPIAARMSASAFVDSVEGEGVGSQSSSQQLVQSMRKMPPGESCRWDEDCVSGAVCEVGAVAGLLRYCVCKPPLLGFDGRCVLPGRSG